MPKAVYLHEALHHCCAFFQTAPATVRLSRERGGEVCILCRTLPANLGRCLGERLDDLALPCVVSLWLKQVTTGHCRLCAYWPASLKNLQVQLIVPALICALWCCNLSIHSAGAEPRPMISDGINRTSCVERTGDAQRSWQEGES